MKIGYTLIVLGIALLIGQFLSEQITWRDEDVLILLFFISLILIGSYLV